nr:MAG TPA: hypothetical protein [Caudoviricetes sp.]
MVGSFRYFRIKCGVWWTYSFDCVPFSFRMAGKSKQIPLFKPVFSG